MTSVGHDIVVMSTFPEHLISPLIYIEVHVVLSFVSHVIALSFGF